SQREGKIMMIGTELRAGEKYPETMLYQHFDPSAKPGNQKVMVRPVVPGDRVEKGQLVVILDDQEARAEYMSRLFAKDAAHYDSDAAKATLDILVQDQERKRALFKARDPAVSEFEVKKAELDVVRGNAEWEKKKADEIKAQSDLEK